MPEDTFSTLAQLNPGESGTLVELRVDSLAYRHSLYAMGLLPGVLIKVVRLAPLGDPMQIEVYGSQLAIRRRDAEGLIVSPDRSQHGH
jgi:ferrous iron transport protein A